ncbi:MAG: tRNA lysidine(34) synthetase TilS [Hyphomicrobium sp.]|nr:MAG: tRNA lysidine(34) synthetase TilS [Hyphomicrobium sp.]
MSEADEGPLTDAELAAFAQRLLGSDGDRHLLVAVSGGVDSMALMHLAAEAVRKTGRGRVMAATVDHGLRPESADEARFVAEQAQRIGLVHRTLVWHGVKPSTGIQAAARNARYHLLAQVYHSELCGRKTLLTAHTLDDQAETVLMRLARGSGVEGLSGIGEFESFKFDVDERNQSPLPAALRRLEQPVGILRPLLHVPKSRLIATMRARGLTWIEDPSNENAEFERVRIRGSVAALQELGLTSDALARSARRLRSVRDALAELTLRALNDPAFVRIDPLGFAVMDRRVWSGRDDRLVEPVQLRVLAALVRMVGGMPRPLSLASLEDVARQISIGWHGTSEPSFAATLGHSKIERTAEGVVIVREAGRRAPARLVVNPGQSEIWDHRFFVNVGAWSPAALEVRELGEAGARALKADGLCPASAPVAALRCAPAFFDGERLVAVPSLAEHWRRLDPEAAARFAPALEGPCVSTFQDHRSYETTEVID